MHCIVNQRYDAQELVITDKEIESGQGEGLFL